MNRSPAGEGGQSLLRIANQEIAGWAEFTIMMECVTPESSHCYLYSTLWSVGVTIKAPIQRVPHDSTTGWGAGNRDLGLCVLESRAYCLLYRKILLHMVPQASILHNKLQSVQYIPFILVQFHF